MFGIRNRRPCAALPLPQCTRPAHPPAPPAPAGGMEEYEAVKAAVGALPPSAWVSSEVRLLNRPTAPVLLLVWKRP